MVWSLLLGEVKGEVLVGGEMRRWMVSERTMTEKDARAKQKATLHSKRERAGPIPVESRELTGCPGITHHCDIVTCDAFFHSLTNLSHSTLFFRIPL
jgi:hypothetical protein